MTEDPSQQQQQRALALSSAESVSDFVRPICASDRRAFFECILALYQPSEITIKDLKAWITVKGINKGKIVSVCRDYVPAGMIGPEEVDQINPEEPAVVEADWEAPRPEQEYETLRSKNSELLDQNRNLQSLVAQERRTAAREVQKFDQLLAHMTKLQEERTQLLARLKQSQDGADALQHVLIARTEGRMRMFEAYSGIVMHVLDDEVVVVYEIDDDYVEQTYQKSRFQDGRLPKKGQKLGIYVHLAELPEGPQTETGDLDSRDTADERPRRRRNTVKPPREF